MNSHSTDESLNSDFVPSQESEKSQAPSSSNTELDLEELMERFTQECRKGLKPSVEKYALENPSLAEEIRELFPTLLALEKGGVSESFTSCQKGIEPVVLERLGNYRIVRELGRGGMGVVYEAWDETLERVVALKVMKIFPGEEEQTTQRFHREAKIMAGLHHTNIVPVYGSDSDDNKLFFAMQLIDGISLEEFLQKREQETLDDAYSSQDSSWNFKFRNDFKSETNLIAKSQSLPDKLEELSVSEMMKLMDEHANFPKEKNRSASIQHPRRSRRSRSSFGNLSQIFNTFLSSDKTLRSIHIAGSNYYQRVCDIGIQTAQALEYAHRHNVIHRDVKPSNLILDKDGVVWITDFGLAKLTDDADLTKQGQQVGTLRYLAPESLEGQFSPKSDVYSLGLTLYELLTFTPAFNETNYSKLYGQVRSSEPIRPRKLVPQIPADLETIVLKAMDRIPEKRYDSAGEMADDLRRFLDERPIRARRIGFFERSWRWCKRNQLVASLLFSVFFLINFLLVYMTISYKHVQKEWSRAQNNLVIALEAFDQVFDTLGENMGLQLDLLDETSAFYTLNPETTITDKERRTLENLLVFYDRFAKDAEGNEDDPTLLSKSALAYAKIGKLRRLLGRTDSSQAFENSISQYRRSLGTILSTEDREKLILQKANLLDDWLGSEPIDDPQTALEACSESLLELERDVYKQTEVRDVIAAKLRFRRAIIELLTIRRDSSNVLKLFEEPVYQLPSSEGQKKIEKDFEAAIQQFQSPQTSKQWFQLCQTYSSSALWHATIGDSEKARSLFEQGERSVDDFEDRYGASQEPSVYYARILQGFLKALVKIEAYNSTDDVNKKEAILKAYLEDKDKTLNTVDQMASQFSNSPQERATQVFVYYRFAKLEARRQNLEETRNLLEGAYGKMKEFTQTFPDYKKFQNFASVLTESFAELSLHEKRLDEAAKYIQELEDNMKDLESSPIDESASLQDVDHLKRRQKSLDMLKKVLNDLKKEKA